MKKWSIALTGLLLAATLASCGSQKVVATTNGGNITEPAYYSSLKETPSGQQVLQQMILSKVLKKGDVSIKDSQLKQVLSDYMSSSSSNASSK